jgi:hypothetical protein
MAETLTDAQLKQALAGGVGVQPRGPLTWGQVPGEALRNTPQSAANFATNMAHPFLHPIETAETFYDLGRGLLAKAGMLDAPDAEEKVNAVGQFFAERYGSMEGLKQTLATDPVGVLADASVVLGGTGLAVRGPGLVGKAGEVMRSAGAAVDPVKAVGKVASTVGGKVIAPILGTTTGVGARPIQEAGKAGLTGNRKFVEHMRGKGDINEPIDLAKRGVSELRQRRSDAYKSGQAGYINDPTHLNAEPIGKALHDAAKKISPHGVPKSDAAAKTLQQISDKLDEYLHLPPTVDVLDDIKQAIGEIRQKTEFGTLERVVADDIYNATKDVIVKQAPQYADTMKVYSEASDNLTNMTKTLSLGEKATKDTALRKLQSTMRDNVNTNYGQRTKLADELAALEPDLMPALAGQSLSSVAPRGIQRALAGAGVVGGGGAAAAGMLNPWALAAIPLASPRVVGEAAYLTGAAGRKIGNAVSKGSGPAQQLGRLAINDVPALGASLESPPESLSDRDMRELLKELSR